MILWRDAFTWANRSGFDRPVRLLVFAHLTVKAGVIWTKPPCIRRGENKQKITNNLQRVICESWHAHC